ncbi:MAG: alpha/beta hydrolase [Kordiimonadaceae bacterium]|nr:alpha/beta hydrolase [Kordiimonadaceae bacterium]MBT6031770.1 alpha/beta hydrolase [Kordiimonadaceae bacterium]MBT6328644.1 alpha/beta hydrolase [Kordiimonadaceae bacterium]MBT7581686.1 alpha/beta hydrolase [Kordiimonadaceae bacterium]
MKSIKLFLNRGRYLRHIAVLFLLIGYAQASFSQTTQDLANNLPAKKFEYPWDVKVFDLPVSKNGVAYRLYIRAPIEPPQEGEKPSSFYFLDPLALFTPAASMSYNYEYFNYTPSAYFIGIGYQDEADGTWKEENRTRDYTPTAFAPPDASHFLSGNPVDYENSGGADAFLDVVRDEVIPFIEAKYEVDAEDRVLIGKSMSGLAAAYSLMTRPGMFKRYLIISPAIWWDDFLYPRMERAIMKTAEATKDAEYPIETRAYFAVGDGEERMSLVTDLYVLFNSLQRRFNPNLKVNIEVLPDEAHEGVFPNAFMRGMVGVYSDEENRKASASKLKWK